jgi:DNA repair ATPase RecN
VDNSNNAELLNLKNKNNALLNENNQLKTEISNLKSTINNLNNTIEQLKQANTELNNLKLKYENDINQLKSEKSDILNKLKNMSENKSNSISNIKSSSYEKDELVSALMDKDKEIKKLNKAFPFEIKDGDQLLTVIFVSVDEKIHYYSFICKDSEQFSIVENRLYEVYPEYKGENTFIVRGNKIKKNRTLKENNIQYSDIIMLIPNEF